MRLFFLSIIKIFQVGYFLLFLPSLCLAEALNWRINEEAQQVLALDELYEYMPTIKQASDIEQLLQIINQKHPFLNLEAYKDEEGILIKGQPADIITKIDIKLMTSYLKDHLRVIKQDFISQVDSIDNQEKMITKLKTILEHLGFLNHQIDIEVKIIAHQASYLIMINEGLPSLINNIHMPFKVPFPLRLKIGSSDICSFDAITSAIDTLEDDLKDIGFVQSQMNIKKIDHSEDKRSCDVFISGYLGKKIEYKIIDDTSHFSFNDYLKGGKYASIDFHINDPDIMREEIIKLYHSKGYEQVEVSKPEIIEKNEQQIVCIFNVTAGPQFIISDVIFEGARQFSKDELLGVLGITNFWNIPIPLNREEINQSIDKLEKYYISQGFWDAKILTPRITKNAATFSAQIVFIIKEGKKRILNEIFLEGHSYFTKEQINDQIQLNKTEELTKEKINQIEENIRSMYLKNGFLYAKAFINLIPKTRSDIISIDLKIQIKENKRVKIGSVRISGLVKTKREVVEREIKFKQGDWYDPDLINQTRKSLTALGIFSSIQISATQTSAQSDQPNAINLLIDVKEGRLGSISFGPGYNIIRGFNYVGEFSYKNILGWSRQLSLRASISEEKHQTSINNEKDTYGKTFIGRKIGFGYLEPYILNLPINANISVSHIAIADNIWKISNTLELSLIHNYQLFSQPSQLTGFYNLRQAKDEGSDIQEVSLVTTGNTQVASIGMRSTTDYRDSLAWTSKGGLFEIEAQLAEYFLGGDYKYLRSDIKKSIYLSLTDDLVFVFFLNLTAYENIEGRKINQSEKLLPSTERLLARGVNLVRGFESELGPYVTIGGNKNIVGGTKRAIGKFESRYRMGEMLALSFFFDSGNTFLSAAEVKKFAEQFDKIPGRPTIEDNINYEFKELLYKPGYFISRHYLSYGLALNWLTPIGPINTSLSWPLREPPSPRCSEEGICFSRVRAASNWYNRYQFDLSVGAAF